MAKVLLHQTDIHDIDVANVLISATAYDLYYAAENATQNMKKTITLGVSIKVFSLCDTITRGTSLPKIVYSDYNQK